MKTKMLSYTLASLSAAMALSVGAQSAMPRGDTGAGTSSESDMMKWDKNKDGMISKSEAKSDKDLTSRWKDMDTNGDGMIDASEMTAMNANTPNRTGGGPAGSGTGSDTTGSDDSTMNPSRGTSTVPSTGRPSVDSPTGDTGGGTY